MEVYLACIEYFLELLYLIKDMQKTGNEKMVKNANILQQKLFTLQICEITKFGLENYDQKVHPKYLIATLFRFNNMLNNMLEVYAQGKNLYIQTHKERNTKKKSTGESDDEMDALDYADSAPSFVSKRFNFKTVVIELTKYSIIDNLCYLLKDPKTLDNELIEAIATFMNRVRKQAKGTFIFYQINTMNSFDYFVSDYKRELRYLPIINAIKAILASFFERCKENPLLPLEICFPFPDLQTKAAILTNYEAQTDVYDPENVYEPPRYDDSDGEEELDVEKFNKKLEATKWTEEEEKQLLEYYELFKDNPTSMYEKLSTVLNRHEEAIIAKLTEKGLLKKKKTKESKKADKENDENQDVNARDLESESKDKEVYRQSKEFILDFIRQCIDKSVSHAKIIEYLQYLLSVVKDYLEFEEVNQQLAKEERDM